MKIRFNSVAAHVIAQEQRLIKRIEMAQIKKQIEVLATFMPDEILKMPLSELDSSKTYVGVLLFADVSGFTPLCEKYNKTGKGGIYRLTATLNAYIGAIVEVLYFYGGDVLKFSGDAFLALWKVMPDDCLYEIIHEVIVCALFIQHALGTFETEVNVSLKVKLAIACGNMTFAVIGDELNKHYVILGSAINDVKAAEHASVSGDIVIAPNTWEHMLQERYESIPAANGNVKVRKIYYKPNELKKKATYDSKQAQVQQLCEQHVEHRTLLHRHKRFDDNSTDSKITEDFIRSLPPRHGVKLTARHWIIEDLKPFIIGPVQNQVIESQPVEYLTEMREITIQFINIVPATFCEHKLVVMVDKAYQIICHLSGEVLGVVNKVSLFDKDAMILVLFGLRGNKHEMESQNALLSAYKIRRELIKLEGVDSVSIGVTNGFVYCGVVGHPHRREYTVIGGSVNKAARIMCAYPHKVTCDYKTFKTSKLSSYYFQLQSAVKLKGIQDAGNIYEYNELFETVIVAQEEDPPMVGRNGEYNLVRSIIYDPEKANGYYGICIHSDGKHGVSRVLRTVLASVMKTTTPVASIELSQSKMIPYYCVSKLYMQLWNRKARRNSTEMYSIRYLPSQMMTLQEVMQNSDEDASSRKFRMFNYFRDICKFTLYGFTVLFIDNFQCIDQQSWEILQMTLPENNLRLVCGAHFEEPTWDLQYSVSLNPHIKLLELDPIPDAFVPHIACLFLRAEGIPNRLLQMLIRTCKGRPGWIQSCLLRLVNNGSIELELIKMENADFNNFVFPNADTLSDLKIVPLILVNDKFNAQGIADELTLAAISLDLFDSFTPYQQLVIKTGAVLGEIFTRSMIMVLLKYPPENVFASVIQHLFEEEVFDCGSRYVNGKEIMLAKVCCRCFIETDSVRGMRSKFPKYAFCKVLHFKNKSIRDVAYNLLPANQRKELHLRITDVLENQMNRCPSCLRDNSAALINLHKFRDVMNECTDLPPTVQQNDNDDVPYPNMKNVIRSHIVEVESDSDELLYESDLKVIPERKLWNPITCYCVEIMARVYQDLIYHSEQSAHLGKRIFFTMQYGVILIWIFEYGDAIQCFNEASELCLTDARMKTSQINTMFRKLHVGKTHQYLAHCYIKLKQFGVAKNHLIVALRQYNVPIMALNYKFCSRFLYRSVIANFERLHRKAPVSNYIRQDLARCMALVSYVMNEEGVLNMARKCMRYSIYLFRTSNANLAVICKAFARIIDIYNFCGDQHTCWKLHRSIGRDIMRMFDRGTVHDIHTVGYMLMVRMEFSFSMGELPEVIRLGHKCIEMNNTVHAFYNNVPVLQLVSMSHLLYGQYEDCVSANRRLYSIGYVTSSNEVFMIYYYRSLVFYLETGFFFEPINNILKFADHNFYIKKISYSILETCFLVSVYLYYVRLEYLSEASKWKNKIQLNDNHLKGSTIYLCVIFYLEGCLLEYVLNKRMKRASLLEEAASTIHNLIEVLDRGFKMFRIFNARIFILKAYLNRIMNRNTHKLLNQAKKAAMKYSCTLDVLKIMQCINAWQGGYSFGRERVPVHFEVASNYGHIDRAQMMFPMAHE